MEYVYVFATTNGEKTALFQRVHPEIKVKEGKSYKEILLSDAKISIYHGKELQDVLMNTNKCLIVSERLKNYLELDAKNLYNNEIIPITILDKKKAPINKKYFIINQLNHQECVDLENTQADELFMYVKSITIDELRIDKQISILRPKEYSKMLLIKRSLAEGIKSEGFTGIDFGEISNYDRVKTL